MHTQLRCIQVYPKLTYGGEKLNNYVEYLGMPVWDILWTTEYTYFCEGQTVHP